MGNKLGAVSRNPMGKILATLNPLLQQTNSFTLQAPPKDIKKNETQRTPPPVSRSAGTGCGCGSIQQDGSIRGPDGVVRPPATQKKPAEIPQNSDASKVNAHAPINWCRCGSIGPDGSILGPDGILRPPEPADRDYFTNKAKKRLAQAQEICTASYESTGGLPWWSANTASWKNSIGSTAPLTGSSSALDYFLPSQEEAWKQIKAGVDQGVKNKWVDSCSNLEVGRLIAEEERDQQIQLQILYRKLGPEG